MKTCLVTDLAGIDDKSFNATAWQGVLDAIDAGVAAPEPDSFYLESDAEADWQPNIDQMISQGCQHIVTVGFALDAVTQENAAANPDITWAIVDVDFFDFDAGEDVTYENVQELTYQTDEAAFLAGYAAASVSETGIVGTFGGDNFPTVSIFMDGFYYGVQAYNEAKGADVQVLGWDPGQPGHGPVHRELHRPRRRPLDGSEPARRGCRHHHARRWPDQPRRRRRHAGHGHGRLR